MQETIGFLNTLAEAAGSVVRRYYRAGFSLEAKGRNDPVTQADRETEAVLRDLIARAFPADAVQGEEFGITSGTSGRTWVIDPIDGTRAFAIGRPTFTTVIALCEDGIPVAGLLDQPVVGDRWIGVRSAPTLFNGRACHVRSCPDAALSRLVFTAPGQFSSVPERHAHDAASAATGFQVYGGDCYAYGLLASGFADAVLEAGLKAHDIMGLIPIVTGAGGIITDWSGGDITLENCTGQTLACGDAALHQRLLSVIAAN